MIHGYDKKLSTYFSLQKKYLSKCYHLPQIGQQTVLYKTVFYIRIAPNYSIEPNCKGKGSFS